MAIDRSSRDVLGRGDDNVKQDPLKTSFNPQYRSHILKMAESNYRLRTVVT